MPGKAFLSYEASPLLPISPYQVQTRPSCIAVPRPFLIFRNAGHAVGLALGSIPHPQLVPQHQSIPGPVQARANRLMPDETDGEPASSTCAVNFHI